MEKQRAFLIGKGCRSVLQWCKRRDVKALYRWIDIGLNLFSRSFPDPEKTLREAEEAGVYCILTGSDGEENEKVADFVRTHACRGTAGIHPHNAQRAVQADFERIRRLALEETGIVAVGECGLDYDRMFSPREDQLSCLSRHIEIAEETGKPMFLHERSAAEEFCAVFASHPQVCRRAVVHCFTEGPEELERLLSMGFMIGITGWICDDRRALALREAVRRLPLDRVMLETDAPYLTPRNVPGLPRTNVPANIRYVAETLASYMGVEQEALERSALQNAVRFFSLDAEELQR